MKVIQSFNVPAYAGTFYVNIPEGAKFLTAGWSYELPVMWWEVDQSAALEHTGFIVTFDGHLIEDSWTYLGSFKLPDSEWTYHLYLKS